MRQDELPIFPSIESITFAVSLDTNFLLNVTSTSLHSRALLRSMSFKWGNFMMIYKNPMMSLKYTFLEHEKYHLHNHITTSSRAIELSFCQAKMFLMIYVNLDNKARKNCELLFIATPMIPLAFCLSQITLTHLTGSINFSQAPLLSSLISSRRWWEINF